jgi:hypothetical protein
MLLRKRTLLAIAFVGTSVVVDPSMARAMDPALPLTIRPLQGASFDSGTKRAVSYFLSDDEGCKLTLMLADSQRRRGKRASGHSHDCRR